MNVPAGLFDSGWLWLTHLLYGALLLYTIRCAPWWHLRDNESSHVWLGSCVALMLLWQIKAGVFPGLHLHLLGTTLLTLMFGWPFAFLAVTVVILALTWNGTLDLETLSLNALMMGALPVSVSHQIYRRVDRLLPNHYFIYILGMAFFGAMLTMAAVGIVATLVLSLSDRYTLVYLLQNYLPCYLLMIFPEGFMTGMLMSALVVYRPEWVATFDDERYLRDK